MHNQHISGTVKEVPTTSELKNSASRFYVEKMQEHQLTTNNSNRLLG